MKSVNSMHRRMNVDLQHQLTKMKKQHDTSMRIKGEYEELITKLCNDTGMRRKIQAALAEKDRAREPTQATSLGQSID